MHKSLPLAALLFLTACASPLEEKAERARTAMIGLSDAQLKACAGEPTARNRENDADLWSYFRETSRSATVQTARPGAIVDRDEIVGDYFRYCEATFVIQRGRISALEFRGRTATGREVLEPCGAIIDRCVPDAK